ncbi:hypothetical protein A2982_01395 [candidate division WWE3 bacterium RIFCSPLOWO2_01_FULL_39_13]|uniref:Uncharacterized protein n=1 Tax=candidate division WWE3 bacterium RIFCSPLOWO2_01_FULL_39_13 TaxID=1802624 RepID=A0A1F4V4K8_UNCKA|nr:MAG: hypothetical protein A2982_01395 [candidate division WWE3 bacterium RIFCSPLOWO2_01_FULL_39_13]
MENQTPQPAQTVQQSQPQAQPQFAPNRISDRELIEKIYTSVERTRKYFLWTMIITIVIFVLPLIAMAFILPTFISTLTSQYGGISQLGF